MIRSHILQTIELRRDGIGEAPRNANAAAGSVKAAAERAWIAKECHWLALRTGDKDLIAEAKTSFAMVAGLMESN